MAEHLQAVIQTPVLLMVLHGHTHTGWAFNSNKQPTVLMACISTVASRHLGAETCLHVQTTADTPTI